MKVSSSLKLPCGSSLKNRLAKSAMSENMADPGHVPGEKFRNLYKTWAKNEIGLCISGNVMIDPKHLGEPNNVVIHPDVQNFEALKAWAESANHNNHQLWLQLNHPGKQTPSFITKSPVAPSAVSLKPPLDKVFNTPRALTGSEIQTIISQFAYAAQTTKEAGFKGVQIHGAHGYLVSQFLSPIHNIRDDEWGGAIEKRFKFVKEVYLAMRKAVGDDYPIGIKLNSADFSKGGFSPEESVYVAKGLSDLGIDLIEISGGSYEKPVMMGEEIKESTKKREAYFLDYTKEIRSLIKCPLMVTGGFRTSDFIHEVLDNDELDIVGMGRPLCIEPDFASKVLNGEKVQSSVRSVQSKYKWLNQLIPFEIVWYTHQLHRLGRGKSANPKLGVFRVACQFVIEFGLQGLKRVRA